jgi:hypothetical protein
MSTLQNYESNKVSRKNITMTDDTLRELEFLAKLLGKKHSQIIQDLIHRESEIQHNELRLKTLKQMKGLFTGLIGQNQSIQTMKTERQL